MDLPMALSDMVLAMLLPMPHPWSTMPLLSMLPLSLTTLSAMLPPTLLRSPPTPTTMEWLTSTLALPSASPRATMAPVLLRDPTLSTFLRPYPDCDLPRQRHRWLRRRGLLLWHCCLP